MMRPRLSAVALLALASASEWPEISSSSCANEAKSTTWFISLGDWGARVVDHVDDDDEAALDRDTEMSVAAALGQYVASASSTMCCVLSLGDNFYEDGVTSATDRLWEETWRHVWIDPFPAMAGLPWYPVLGNHDYHGSSYAQVLRTSATDDDEWQMPGKTWTRYLACGRVAVVAIDTMQLETQDYDDQTGDVFEEGEDDGGSWSSTLTDIGAALGAAAAALDRNSAASSSSSSSVCPRFSIASPRGANPQPRPLVWRFQRRHPRLASLRAAIDARPRPPPDRRQKRRG